MGLVNLAAQLSGDKDGRSVWISAWGKQFKIKQKYMDKTTKFYLAISTVSLITKDNKTSHSRCTAGHSKLPAEHLAKKREANILHWQRTEWGEGELSPRVPWKHMEGRGR